MAGGRGKEECCSGRDTAKGSKKFVHLRHPRVGRLTNNYGHWCFYSTNPALLGSFIFGRVE
jgi:hypothetical protein